MDFSIIVEHPDRQEIISRLISGEAPKIINQWLMLKYGADGQQHLHIPATTLKSYADSHVDLLDQLQRDIKEHRIAKTSSSASKLTKNSKTYQAIIEELADNELDIKKTIRGIVQVIRTRTEQVFDKIQQQEAGNVGGNKGDYALIKYFEILLNAVEKLDKISNNSVEKEVQHSYTIQYIDQNMSIFHDALRETLSELDYEVSLRIMNRLNEKIMAAKAPVPVTIASRKADFKSVESLEVPELPKGIL
jgi:hypothetical protein